MANIDEFQKQLVALRERKMVSLLGKHVNALLGEDNINVKELMICNKNDGVKTLMLAR